MKLRLAKKFRRAFCAALSTLVIAYNVASLSGQYFTAEPTATPRLTEQARLAKRAELRQAIAEVSAAIKRNPADASAYLRRASIEKEIAPVEVPYAPNYRPAIDDLRKYTELLPNNAEAFIELGNTCLFARAYPQASAAYDTAIKLAPTAELYWKRSLAQEGGNRIYAALQDLDKVIAEYPNCAVCYYRKGQMYIKIRDSQDANASFAKASELDPNNLQYGLRANRKVEKFLTKEQMLENLGQAAATAGVGLLGLAAAADQANYSASQRAVEASGGTKKLCPVCKGSTVNVVPQASGVNPYMRGTHEYEEFEKKTVITEIVPCRTCKGTGIVDND